MRFACQLTESLDSSIWRYEAYAFLILMLLMEANINLLLNKALFTHRGNKFSDVMKKLHCRTKVVIQCRWAFLYQTTVVDSDFADYDFYTND